MGEADPEMIIVTITTLTYRVELVNANCLKQSRRIVDALLVVIITLNLALIMF